VLIAAVYIVCAINAQCCFTVVHCTCTDISVVLQYRLWHCCLGLSVHVFWCVCDR